MALNAESKRDILLASRPRVPENVVCRAFATETVVLNLDTGKYHGLNPSAGRMFEALEQSDTVQGAATALAEEFERPADAIADDLCQLIEGLETRGLMHLDHP